MKDIVEKLNAEWAKKTPLEVLRYFLNEYWGRIAFASSMGAEDQVITDMIARIDPSAHIVTLDTGRLFPGTYQLIDVTQKYYGIKIEVLFPEAGRVEGMVNNKGINLFYESIENRKLCCHIRKMEPLKKILKDLDVWICGIRKDQSVTRYNANMVEWDEESLLLKLSPLIDWTEKQVWEYIRQHDIPYHELHDKGFPSIGCQPCTRAVYSGGDIRSGRWWWEEPEHKECGLHNRPKK